MTDRLIPLTLVDLDPRDLQIAGLRIRRIGVRQGQGVEVIMITHRWWAAGYNIVTIPLAAGVLAPLGIERLHFG